MPFLDAIVHFDSRRNEDMWIHIFYKGSKYKGAVKAAFCIGSNKIVTSDDFMWHDFFWIEHYGAKKPVPEKSSPGKQSGWVLLDVGNGGMEYFSWRKEKQVSFDRALSLGDKKGVIVLKSTRTNRCRDPVTQGLFYDDLLNHYGQVHRVSFMFANFSMPRANAISISVGKILKFIPQNPNLLRSFPRQTQYVFSTLPITMGVLQDRRSAA
jgi:hypothetical protein